MNKLLATAAVSAILSFAPIANDAHALGGEPQDLWHGFYLGSHAGWAEFDSDVRFSAPLNAVGSAFNGSLGESEASFGLQAGINHQMGLLVVGLEADLTFLTAKDDVDFVVFGLTPATQTYTVRDEVDYVGTIRGRIGASVANTVIYFTGGYAFGQVDHALQQGATGLAASSAEEASSMGGYAIGGGGEMHLGTIMGLPMSAKVEYLHIDLEDSTLTSAGGPGFNASTTTFDHEINQVRVGVNVQLGGM